MAVYSFQKVQHLPVSLAEAWSFFSDAANLQTITPPDMQFEILRTGHTRSIYPGQVIEYHVRPLLGIKLYWMTEITHVVEGKLFVDEQRFGPYRFWHHQHHFKEVAGGVEMTDIIHYKLPYGWLGNIMNTLVVNKKLESIFKFRFDQVEKLFAK